MDEMIRKKKNDVVNGTQRTVFESIKNNLLEDSHSTIGLAGPSGSGKTLISYKIRDDEEIRGKYDHVISIGRELTNENWTEDIPKEGKTLILLELDEIPPRTNIEFLAHNSFPWRILAISRNVREIRRMNPALIFKMDSSSDPLPHEGEIRISRNGFQDITLHCDGELRAWLTRAYFAQRRNHNVEVDSGEIDFPSLINALLHARSGGWSLWFNHQLKNSAGHTNDRTFRDQHDTGHYVELYHDHDTTRYPVDKAVYEIFDSAASGKDAAHLTAGDFLGHMLLHSDPNIHAFEDFQLSPIVLIKEFLEEIGRIHPESAAIWTRRLDQREISGYIADDHRGHNDYNDISVFTRSFANLVVSKTIIPPLSIGIFGDWGSGKSFFMHKMQAEVREIISRTGIAETKQSSACWKRVVQIEFNAWHYNEGNLLASLVHHIFHNLQRKDQKIVEKINDKELVRANEKKEQARIKLDRIEKEILLTEGSLAAIRDLIGFSEGSLGIPQFIRYPAVVQAIRGAAMALINILSNKINLVILGFITLVASAIYYYAQSLALSVGLGLPYPIFLFIVKTKYSLELLKKSGISATSDLVDVSKSLENRLAEQEKQKKATRGEFDSAEDVIENIKNQKLFKFHSFLQQREGSDDYRKHLGLPALARDDFERLSEFVSDFNAELEKGNDAAESSERYRDLFSRVILYIDDLDRCSPEQVVKVLEAVHLLMAMPLFVVVVGVDVRWVVNALETQYGEMLRPRGGAIGPTAYDYLEKIFQVPFWLRPMDGKSKLRFIGSMAAKNEPRTNSGALHRDGSAGPPVAKTTEPGSVKPGSEIRPSTEKPTVLEGASSPPEAVPKPMLLNGKEVAWIETLTPLLSSSPRNLKRFVNIYFIIRSTYATSDAEYFSDRANSGFKITLMLLALQLNFVRRAALAFGIFDGVLDQEVEVTQTVRQVMDLELPKTDPDQPDERMLYEWSNGMTVELRCSGRSLRAYIDKIRRFTFHPTA